MASFLFQDDNKVKTAELPALCNVNSSICIYQLIVPHFALPVFMCIYLQNSINKEQNTSFKLSLIFLTVDSLKHLITD